MKTEAHKVTIAMLLCGIVGAAGMAAASAATQDTDVPSVTLRYDSASLRTDAGARAVYRRIVSAAEAVCPANPGSLFLSGAVRHCRAQSIAAAVIKIDNSRLAAIHAGASRSG